MLPTFDESLIIHENYACVFKNKKLYYCQKIDTKTSIIELKEFLGKTLKLNNLKIEKNVNVAKKQNENFLKLKKSHLLKYFLGYLTILCFSFYYIDFNKSKNNNDVFNKINRNLKKISSDSKFTFLSSHLIQFFISSKNSLVTINKTSFKNSMMSLNVSAKKKKEIYNFFKNEESIKIENITFNKNSKVYVANAIYKINRK